MSGFTVEDVDHVHIHVADRDAAARWYGDVLGLRPSSALAAWAQDPQGPLMLSGGGGRTCVALFGRPTHDAAAERTVAFRTDAGGFLSFLSRLPNAAIGNGAGRPLARDDLVDHDLAWSVYFTDPDGNRIELTTYDHDAVARAVARV